MTFPIWQVAEQGFERRQTAAREQTAGLLSKGAYVWGLSWAAAR